MVLLASLSSMASSFTDYFSCLDAVMDSPLPGHILKVGQIVAAKDGKAMFIFPEQGTDELAQIPIEDTVGIIGSEENGLARILSTPMTNNQYVAAQIFVGEDDNQPPMVSCVSMPMPVSNYNPVMYGADYRWLERSVFVNMLRYTKYRPWNWKVHKARFKDVRNVYFDKRNRFHDEVVKSRPHGKHRIKGIKMERNPMKVGDRKAPLLDKVRQDADKNANRQQPAVSNKKPIVLPNS